jgi:hypothetical protein
VSQAALVDAVVAALKDFCYGRRELGVVRLEEEARYLGLEIWQRVSLIRAGSDALLSKRQRAEVRRRARADVPK